MVIISEMLVILIMISATDAYTPPSRLLWLTGPASLELPTQEK